MIVMSIVVLASCNKENKEVDYTVISGTVSNVGELNKMMIRGGNDFKKEITLDSNGAFSDTLHVDNGYYALIMGRDGMYLYLQKGDNLKISTDANNFSGALKYESGNTKLVNEYLMNKSKEKQEVMRKLGGSQIFMMPEERFLKVMDSIKNIDLNILKAAKNLPSDFVNIESKKIKYEYLQNVVMYPRYYEYFNKGAKLEPTENLNKIISSIDYKNSEDYNRLSIYRQMVLSHFISEFRKDGADKKAVIASIKETGIKKLSKDFAATMVEEISPSTPELGKVVELIEMLTDDTEILGVLKDKMAQVEKLSAGKKSAIFNYESIDGKKVSLEDLKGNLVYVDVWATWCGPCKREIPFLQKLEKAYHGKAMKFVSISVDTDKNAWTKMVKDKNMSGIQLFADGNWKADFVTAYGIRSIPRFILIDKEGNIISADAPRPSSGEELTKLLDENIK